MLRWVPCPPLPTSRRRGGHAVGDRDAEVPAFVLLGNAHMAPRPDGTR